VEVTDESLAGGVGMICELPAGRAVVDRPPVMRFIPPC